MLSCNLADSQSRLGWLAAALAVVLFACVAFAQTTVSTGSIIGTVTDASGAVVPNAAVTMTGPTAQTVRATTNGQGGYSFGTLEPGTYLGRVEAKGSRRRKSGWM